MSKITGQSLPPGRISAPEKRDLVDSVVNWLQRNDVNPKGLNEPTVSSLSKLAGIPLSEKLGRPNHKIAEDALNWLTNNDPQNPDFDDDVIVGTRIPGWNSEA